MESVNGDYARLPVSETGRFEGGKSNKYNYSCCLLKDRSCIRWWWWIKGLSLSLLLVVIAGVLIVYAGPFLVHKNWLDKCPEKAAVIRLAGEGNWFHQFRAVALIRVSPFPYILFNYAAVATNVKYGPYICGSLAGTVHETFLTIYSGTLIWSWADATNRGSALSVQQLIYDAVGLCATISATAIITLYAKRALRDLKAHENESSISFR